MIPANSHFMSTSTVATVPKIISAQVPCLTPVGWVHIGNRGQSSKLLHSISYLRSLRSG